MLEQIVVGLFLGILIGVEREYHKKDIGLGVRTSAFISLLGTLSTYFGITYNIFYIVIVSLIAVFSYSIFLFWYRVNEEFIKKKRINRRHSIHQTHVGLTTSVTTVLIFFIGAMCGLQLYKEAVIVAITVFILLFMKRKLVYQIKHLTEEEILNAIEFAILAFVIYPFIPQTPIPWLFNISIKQVWEVVILVSVLYFIGFLAIRKFGETKGLIMAGFFGGLYTSWGTSAAFISLYKKDKKLHIFLMAIIVALTVMLFRNFLIGFILSQSIDVLIPFFKYLMVLIFYTLFIFFVLLRKIKPSKKKIDIKSPFAIKPALLFGIVFFFILLISNIAVSFLGSSAILPVSLFSGFVNSAGAVASAALLFFSGSISLEIFSSSIILASVGAMSASVLTALFFREIELAENLLIYVVGVVALFSILVLL